MSMDQIPRDIDVAVRAAGASSRPYGGELPDVYRRARLRRTRRRAAAAFTTIAVAAGLVGGGLVVRRHTEVVPPVEPAVTNWATQRLLLSGAAGQYATAAHPDPVELRGGLATGELTPDGALTTHRVIGGGEDDRVIGLPDGRLLSLGPRDKEPDPDRASGMTSMLTIVSPSGDIVQRDVDRAEPLELLGADATFAYLWRPTGMFAHDLSTGLERLVISALMMDLPDADPAGALDASDVTGDRLVVAERARACEPMVYDIASPQGIRSLPLSSLGCRSVIGLRLSPSTGRLAVTYQDQKGLVRVAVFNTEDGRTLADRAVTSAGNEPGSSAGDKPGRATVNMAWTDERNLLVVSVPSGPGVHVLRPFTVAT
ncbi:hypothetical protein JIG36_23010 [Actinoplanes sp. LDG1-06]|uniref:Uncharacterized protein n=1 Tax=Paractinoplanes ovalisporus TaxID=2810368 RepID=A0ABS2AF18_9ACTN|nr:hypothetical protein [Actinoplanes ovalisporus]MBM2618435.1 hypothetical protein [Actinoplanes ovalisporus]